jgi:phosphoribosylanthranilate isomerase
MRAVPTNFVRRESDLRNLGTMWIKVCGIRDEETASEVVACAQDAIGLNFYEASPRCVSVDVAAQIVAGLPKTVEAVGLFVNHKVEVVATTCEQTGIGTVQLHGDESPEMLAALHERSPKLEIIRGLRVGEDGLAEVDAYLAACEWLGVPLRACLIDARVAGVYGGSGARAPWELLCDWNADEHRPPLILAGGLDADNVAEAIQQVRPWGVDVASGVESESGVKDKTLVERFVQSARIAFAAIR